MKPLGSSLVRYFRQAASRVAGTPLETNADAVLEGFGS